MKSPRRVSLDPLPQFVPRPSRCLSEKYWNFSFLLQIYVLLIDSFCISQRGLNGGWHLPLSDRGLISAPPFKPQFPEPAIVDICGPELPSPAGRTLLNTEYLLRRDFKDLCNISYLNLHNSKITGIDVLMGLPNLKVLILSFNKIPRITGLEEFGMLERLDLSYNLLMKVEGLSGLNNLLTLDLAGNEICCPDDLRILQMQVLLLLTSC